MEDAHHRLMLRIVLGTLQISMVTGAFLNHDIFGEL